MRDLMETQAMNKDSFSLRSRLPDGGTPALNYWGVDSETGKLLDVLVGPIDNFKAILPTNSMNKKMIRDGIRLDVEGGPKSVSRRSRLLPGLWRHHPHNATRPVSAPADLGS